MKKIRFVILPLILAVYTLLFMATKREFPCDDDCQKVRSVEDALRTNRETYIYSASRCTNNRISDTLCVLVRDTSGINWNLLADTACIIATQKGLLNQQVFILKLGTSPFDTVARKRCP
jgi:hypothetical protein